MYIAMKHGKFFVGRKNIGSVIEGYIESATPISIKWNGPGRHPEKKDCPNMAAIPFGWSYGYDVEFKYKNRTYSMTIHHRTTIKAFMIYLDQLRKARCRAPEVLTRISFVNEAGRALRPVFEVVEG
ncbi:hypothetical protein [Maridesulfovibrio sp.]|uniref:hypothetical protein n=1 Tax=unclassified Maridesulfovibrio TaxID=2794999 RepID=UPI003AFF8A14